MKRARGVQDVAPDPRHLGRRGFLALGAAGAASALLDSTAWALDPVESLELFGVAPQNLSTPLDHLASLITPTPVFFVRSHFGPPALDRRRRLLVGGQVKRPRELDVGGLRRYKEVSVTAVLQCAGNGRGLFEPHMPGTQWLHGAMGQAEWTGVRLLDLLEDAGLSPTAAHVRTAGADRPPKPSVPAFHRSLPIARALDPSTLVATRMNGAPLTLSHGAPMRLVVPGWSGNHWLKWLTRLEAHEQEADGFFTQKGYRYPKRPVAPGAKVAVEDTVPVTVMPVRSVIARPTEGLSAAGGPTEVVGIAFSGGAAIARVEVRLDGGPWVEASLEGAPQAGRWQVFRHRQHVARGVHRVEARATDTAGAGQPERPAWNPSGYLWNAWHAVTWTAT